MTLRHISEYMAEIGKSPYCECEGNTECGVCITERQDADRLRDWERRTPVRCICPADAAYHTTACTKQDWMRNTL